MASTLNYTIDLVEAKKLKQRKERELAKKQSVPEAQSTANFSLEQREFIQEVMFDLNQEEFLVLYLRHWRDFNTTDIAKLLNLKEQKIKEYLASGMTNLREMYSTRFSQWKENLKARMLQL